MQDNLYRYVMLVTVLGSLVYNTCTYIRSSQFVTIWPLLRACSMIMKTERQQRPEHALFVRIMAVRG